jgi:magnesium transporter
MIHVLLHDPASGALRTGDETLIEAWDRGGDALIWLDLDCHDTEAARALLTGRFGINALAVSDALRERHPPKLEWFDDYFFVLFKGFTAETADINFSVVHISMFVGRNFLLTVHALPSPSVRALREAVTAGALDMRRGTAHLCYRLLRRIVDRYAPVILGLESRLDALEESLTERPGDAVLLELVNYNSRLKKLRRTFGYQQACLDELRHAGSPLFNADSVHEFQDVYEHMERLTSLSALMQELSRDLMEGYISLNGHRLNSIMKTLTIASVIFMPLTFLAGIYGMNFDHMPELHAETGYFVLLGAMVAIAAALLWIFRRVRWL